jgi:putative ABC transport system ATP-binding protein
VEQPLLLTDLSRELRVCAVQAALQLVGMDGQGAREPGELSGGQQQRVAIARALVANPALLLCDEPTGGLDTHTAAQLLELLELVNQAMGTTVVMVTHDPAAAARADRQLHMACGRVSAAQLAA